MRTFKNRAFSQTSSKFKTRDSMRKMGYNTVDFRMGGEQPPCSKESEQLLVAVNSPQLTFSQWTGTQVLQLYTQEFCQQLEYLEAGFFCFCFFLQSFLIRIQPIQYLHFSLWYSGHRSQSWCAFWWRNNYQIFNNSFSFNSAFFSFSIRKKKGM